MEASIHRFVRLLRIRQVRISTSEVLDAMRCAREPGVLADRATLKAALQVSLVKDIREKKEASKSRKRFWEMAGSKMGKITGAWAPLLMLQVERGAACLLSSEVLEETMGGAAFNIAAGPFVFTARSKLNLAPFCMQVCSDANQHCLSWRKHNRWGLKKMQAPGMK